MHGELKLNPAAKGHMDTFMSAFIVHKTMLKMGPYLEGYGLKEFPQWIHVGSVLTRLLYQFTCALRNSFREPCFPGILHPLWLLQPSPLLPQDSASSQLGRFDGDLLFKLYFCIMSDDGSGFGSLHLSPSADLGSLSDNWIRH